MKKISEKSYMENIKFKLNQLIIYRNIINDPIIKSIEELFIEISKEYFDIRKIEEIYFGIIHKIIIEHDKKGFKGDLIKNYIIDMVMNDENIFNKNCDKYKGNISKSIYEAVLHDLNIIKEFLNSDFSILKKIIGEYQFIEDYIPTIEKNYSEEFKYNFRNFYEKDEHEIIDNLIDFYSEKGYGKYSCNTAFRWNSEEKNIEAVMNYDDILFENIIGYNYQKETIIKNTNAFIDGKKSNNILLIGARGTGKSSCVKAVVNLFSKKGLKIVEIDKKQIVELPYIMEKLSESGRKFIIFIDDLSFEDRETDYKNMKSVIEGGLEKPLDNILLYATSNRRHIIKENWKDREDIDEEIHLNDTVNEKLSLSDRFGIKITFISPNQKEYLDIVDGLAKINGLKIDENLHQEALKWEMSQNQKSGRTAKQFIDYMIGVKTWEK